MDDSVIKRLVGVFKFEAMTVSMWNNIISFTIVTYNNITDYGI